MRKTLLAVSLLFAVSSFAQQSDKFRLSVFASNPGYVESSSIGGDFSGGIGAALEYRWQKQWALELSLASEEYTYRAIDRVEAKSYPIDLVGQYHFRTGSRWQPFLGAGVRHVQAPDIPGMRMDDRTSFEIQAGMYVNLTRALSLRIDAKRLLRDDSVPFDRITKTSIGFGWRF